MAKAAFQVPFILCVSCLLYFFYKTWRSDPGYIKSSEEETKQTIVTLAESGLLDFRTFCTACLVKKPLRSMHCHACKSCVAKFDHHCVWTGRCIGAGNQHFFVLFLFSLVLVGYWIIYATSIYWRDHCVTHKGGILDFLMEVLNCSPWIVYMFVITCCLTIWATLMFLMQMFQIVFLGLTTQERVSIQIQNRQSKNKVSLRKTPFNRGCIQNLAEFFNCQCFGLIKTNRVDWTKQYHTAMNLSMMRNAQAV
ncbi:palmitoyltransferase ZDHHC13 [Bombina bombina]|uniref:palmitoyltransferase ZDHHC13 n=1 Tax=Bombina bombina TaxID=8345 RepID=UPI00235A64C1|nr:palmitoyltransferase ZDHHC13 [Bombina bombina]